MKHEISCSWRGTMAFDAIVDQHTVRMDVPGPDGAPGTGPSPKKLLLAALAGCTGMDIISILKKMREPVTRFDIRVEAEVAEEHPRRYTRYLLTYVFSESDGLNRDNVIKAATLSQDKYCGVSASLSPGAPVDWTIEFV